MLTHAYSEKNKYPSIFLGSAFYRPQRSCGQGYVFTRVCDSVYRGGSASVHAGIPTPPGAGTPQRQTPPGVGTPPTPRKQAPPGIRSMIGRYASYWNAFLFIFQIFQVSFWRLINETKVTCQLRVTGFAFYVTWMLASYCRSCMMRNLMNQQHLPNYSIIKPLSCLAAPNIFVSLFTFKTSVK